MAQSHLDDQKEFQNVTEGERSTDRSINSDEGLVEGDYGSGRDHAFADPKVADYWRSIYEKAQYEGRHRFDTDITWSADEEKKLKRRVMYRGDRLQRRMYLPSV